LYFANRFDEARQAIGQSTYSAQVVGDRYGIAAAAIAKGELEFASGQIDAAINTAHRLIDEGQYNRRQLTLCLNNLTSYYIAADRFIDAKLTAFNGLHKAMALGWPAAVARMIEFIALLSALGGDYVQAGHLVGYSERFYETETASREITEQRAYDRLCAILAASLDRSRLAELRAEGSGMSEKTVVEEILRL
jgi:hypothetical protein